MKKVFGLLLNTFSERKFAMLTTATRLRGLLAVVLICGAFFTTQAQTFVQNRYYQVILRNTDGTETKLSQHITQLTAETKLDCRDGYVIPPTGKVLGAPTKICPVYRVTDTISETMFRFGNVISPNDVVLDNCKYKYIVAKLPTDTVPSGEFVAVMERTKDFKNAVTTYRLIGMEDLPAFRVVENVVSQVTMTTARIDIGITKRQTKIVGYLNGQAVKTFAPGTSEMVHESLYRYYFTYTDLLPSTEYEVFTENTSVDGEVARSVTVRFKTAP